MFSKRTAWELNPNRFTEVHRQLQAGGIKLFDLTVSNPTRIDLHFDTAPILNALSNPGVMEYDPQPKGLAAAREAVARYYKEQHQENSIDPDALILATSTSEGYSYVFRLLCDPGDEVLVPKPSYPLFEFLADIQDVKLRPYPLLYDHGWQIDFSSLENAPSACTRAVVLVHPNNPTGSFVSAQERTALNSFCREHGLALIVDEVFLDYPLDGIRRPSFVTNPDVLTFTLSGISKISALPQMKLAWLAVSGPPAEAKAAIDRLEMIADTYLSMNAPVQLAAPTLLEQRKQIQPLLIERVRTNLHDLDRQLEQQKLCQRLQLEGGWYAVLRVPATKSDEELAIDLLRRGSVLVHPGHFYDFPNDGYLILSLLPPLAEFRQAVKQMISVLNAENPHQTD
jgi:alanine-synthesizing transaminase